MELTGTGLKHAIAGKSTQVFTCALLVLLAAMLALQLHGMSRIDLPEARIDIDQTWFNDTDTPSPPSEVEYGNQIRLGDERTPRTGAGWYTTLLDLKVAPNRLWGIYMPTVLAGTQVYINGEIVGTAHGSTAGSTEPQGHIAAYLNIPNGMLLSGSNEIQFHIHASRSVQGSLYPYHLGPDSILRPVYDQQRFVSQTLVKFSIGLLLFTAIAFSVVWVSCHQEELYGWFAIVCFLWALLSGIMILPGEFSGSVLSADLIYDVLLISFAVSLFLFSQRLLEKHSRLSENLCVALGLLCMITAVLFYSNSWSTPMHVLARLFAAGILVYAAGRLSVSTTGKISLTGYSLLLPISMLVTLLMIESVALFSSQPMSAGASIHLVAPLFISVMSFRLIRDFVQSKHELQSINEELEDRVIQRTLELERNFQRLKELEKEQVLSDERERIMMEMHDGMGGHLVSMLSMLELKDPERDNLKCALQDALEDLRMVIDSLEPANSDIGLALGMYRERLDRTLYKSSIKLLWNVDDMPEVDNMSPAKTLQVLRIVQEAVTNSLKYAHCTELQISSGSHYGQAFVEIRDNGTGIASKRTAGKGLLNMQNRADDVGATLDIASSSNGVVVALLLPCKHSMPINSRQRLNIREAGASMTPVAC